MAFVHMQGIRGKVFVPDGRDDAPKKHPCKDCHLCGWCSDDRCVSCLRRAGKAKGTKCCKTTQKRRDAQH